VPELAARFEAIRAEVLISERDKTALKAEILAMRERVMKAHRISSERFDVKHSAGGMVDVEFAVQYLVLAHAAQHPSLMPDVGNIALLHAAEKTGLLPSGVGEGAANAYRELRRAQHLARLDEQNPQVALDALQNEQSAVKALWRAVFA
jgi:[glutamine synthetase] adenylyltransferase / [glutamine synthetase]-adenylyl-L-tyrosine phosphorylase